MVPISWFLDIPDLDWTPSSLVDWMAKAKEDEKADRLHWFWKHHSSQPAQRD